jgi:hypothetical protein
LYDRLVVPVATDDDVERWRREQWDPDRQAKLLDILGPFAERFAWNPDMRELWAREWSQANLVHDIDGVNFSAKPGNIGPDAPPNPYGVTRMIISEQLANRVSAESGDVRAIGVYAKPDQFDREWKINWTKPFIQRTRHTQPGALRQVAAPESLEMQRVAKVVVTRLVIPDDGISDQEALMRTVDLVSRADVALRRARFHELLASLEADNLSDNTIVSEVEDLLVELNESVRRHTKAQRARAAVLALTTAEGAAALWLPPVGVATGPTAALGEAAIERRWSDQSDKGRLSAVSLLAEAQQALTGDEPTRKRFRWMPPLFSRSKRRRHLLPFLIGASYEHCQARGVWGM